ncbi:hypothetical protein GCM10025772_22470 [Ferrimonas gelatinilytica]|uniref:Integrase catalytic domain-containing protein n=1 Tax=Ferrimonas gelatinilytica TaxID=1255257 RepID=A0ABP9S8A3_9GAMM
MNGLIALHRDFCTLEYWVAKFIIKTTLTDDGKEFTDCFFATGQRQPTSDHEFDTECTDHGIEHRLISPATTQSNGIDGAFQIIWIT